MSPMKRTPFTDFPASARQLTADQYALSRWFSALLLSGRGPRKITKVDHALRDVGMTSISYETLCKAAGGRVALPMKYVVPLAAVYGLTDDETAAFTEAALLANAPADVAACYHRARKLPEHLPVPNLVLDVAV